MPPATPKPRRFNGKSNRSGRSVFIRPGPFSLRHIPNIARISSIQPVSSPLEYDVA